jgi:hypothetical protein
MAIPSTYKESDGSPVEFDDAKKAWFEVARPVLEKVAKNYHATITYADLAAEIQSTTGICTKTLTHYWIGAVLGEVSGECQRNGEPLLSALCVNAEGSVGPGYGVMLADVRGEEIPEDLDQDAAEERLRCYVHFGATIPANGGKAALTPKLAAKRERLKIRTKQARVRPVCPKCFLEYSLNGECGCY